MGGFADKGSDHKDQSARLLLFTFVGGAIAPNALKQNGYRVQSFLPNDTGDRGGSEARTEKSAMVLSPRPPSSFKARNPALDGEPQAHHGCRV